MSKTVVDDERRCEHCGRTFQRDNTLLKHLCEPKRRWMDRDRPANRIAHAAWQQYYQTCHPNKRNLEYTDFMRSAYFSAFVKFGGYCVDIRAVNPSAYVTYLIKNRTPIDNWNSDRNYTKYLIEYLRLEDGMEAVRRSIDHMLTLSEQENISLLDVLRFVNPNRICHMITVGHISPWVLYNSDSGREFLSKLNEDQSALVMDYIDPERWQIKFMRETGQVNEIKALLKQVNSV
jgi:hypothetical protein